MKFDRAFVTVLFLAIGVKLHLHAMRSEFIHLVFVIGTAGFMSPSLVKI